MIRFSISRQTLEQQINVAKATWLTRAKTRTDDIRNGTRTNITNIWSEIKSVFMTLQGPKCAFCEKWIEDDQAIEFDVEHFRPKNRITRWPLPARLRNRGITLTQPATGSEPGYRLLAYHHLNYVAACKTCNTTFKKDWFPIAGIRDATNDDPTQMSGEKPYLIYPVSDFDEAPESLIEFHGISPRAKQTGFGELRALVTIEFFGLDNTSKRKGLLKARAEKISQAYLTLRMRDSAVDTADRTMAETAIRNLTGEKATHTNAVRCFVRLWDSDQAEAISVYRQINQWLSTVSQ